MIIPCIDLQKGVAVQLVRGRRRALAVRDVFGLLDRFKDYPILHIIDLDAAMRRGSNGTLVRALCAKAHLRKGPRIRVGGGIRTVARAARIIGWGAEKVIVGSAAFKRSEINHAVLIRLRERLGRKRILIALDADRGHIVVNGWREKLRLRPADVMGKLRPYCSGFLCTYVDAEGTLEGTNLQWFRSLRRATRLPITAAGGIRSVREVRALARIKMDAAVGMAIYRGLLA